MASLSLHEKCPNTEVFSVPCFPGLGLNMEIYRVDLRIQYEYRKIRTRKISVFGHLLRSVCKSTNFEKDSSAFNILYLSN